MSRRHLHVFEDCRYDAQQCDSSCRAEHKCAVCKKTRSQLAKNTKDVRAHVSRSTKDIIRALQSSLKAPSLAETVAALVKCSDNLEYLTRQQLVELAIWKERND